MKADISTNYPLEMLTIDSAVSQDTEKLDVYCFGHLLYEITFAEPLNSPSVDDFPGCPPMIRELFLNWFDTYS